MEINQIKELLKNPEFFKNNLPKTFLFKPWKKALKLYQNADNEIIIPNYFIKKFSYEDKLYYLYALSMKGAIKETSLEAVKKDAEDFKLENIRYIAAGNGGFYPLLNDKGEVEELTACSSSIESVYFFVIAAFNDEGEDKLISPNSLLITKDSEVSRFSFKTNLV